MKPPSSGDAGSIDKVVLESEGQAEAVKRCDIPCFRVTDVGLMNTVIPFFINVIVAVADFVGSATEVALTVTFDELVMELGAV